MFAALEIVLGEVERLSPAAALQCRELRGLALVAGKDAAIDRAAALLAEARLPPGRAEALRLMDEADTAVERSNVPGTHPLIAEVARDAAQAYYADDLLKLRVACGRVIELTRTLYSEPDSIPW